MLYEIAIIFFAWSFLAWVAETAVATIKGKTFRSRGGRKNAGEDESKKMVEPYAAKRDIPPCGGDCRAY